MRAPCGRAPLSLRALCKRCGLLETLSGARCNSYGPIGSFCGRPCDIAAPCPEGYTCDGTKQCIRVEGACTCSEDAILTEAKTLCFSLPGGEPCEGIRWCTEEGLTPCSSSDLEQCDGIDNNCNGLVDEDLSECAPETPVDEDGDGFSLLEGDCDDSNGDRYPGASDVDGVDNDCDGEVDEAGEGMPCLLSNDFGECEGSSTCENGIPGCIGEPANECGGCGALPSNYQSPVPAREPLTARENVSGGSPRNALPRPALSVWMDYREVWAARIPARNVFSSPGGRAHARPGLEKRA